jgi:hypothetical protein
MEIYPDFRELLECFNARSVEYVIVGGYALAHYGTVRATKDMDIYVRPTEANAQRVMAALEAFGFGKAELAAEDFARPGQVIQLGYPPVRVDLVTSLTGVTWEQVAAGQTGGDYGGAPAPFIGRAELIANKRATARLQDLADVERLEGPPK